jgi:twitching motility protein PilU
LLLDLSLNLRAFVSQRLIKTVDNKRAAAVEILLGTPLVQDMIRRGDVHEIKEIMDKSEGVGMQTFDRALYKLAEAGRISMDEALKNADSPNNLRLKLTLDGKAEQKQKTSLGLSLIEKEENDEDEDGGDALSA